MEAVQSGQASIFSFIYQVVGGLMEEKSLYPFMDRGLLKSGNLFDDNLKSGIYCVNQDQAPCVNRPNNELYGVYVVEKTTYDYTKVSFMSVTSGNLYISYRSQFSWLDWKKIV